MKQLLYSHGEPAGIGVDLILRLSKLKFWEEKTEDENDTNSLNNKAPKESDKADISNNTDLIDMNKHTQVLSYFFIKYDMFKNITLADDLEFKYSTNAPTMLIEGMVVAGK